MKPRSSLGLYTDTARRSAAPVIRSYSTSFGLATRMFPARCRTDIGTIYALVRVADEIVDGTAGEAGLDAAAQRRALDEFEAETERAVASGFSANLVVHAFAEVARRVGIEPQLTRDVLDTDPNFHSSTFRRLSGRRCAPARQPRRDRYCTGCARLGNPPMPRQASWPTTRAASSRGICAPCDSQ